MVAEISKGSQNFWDAPLAQPPANFGSKVVFGKQLSRNWCKNKFVAHVHLWWREQCVSSKTICICNAKLGRFGR